MNKVSVVGSIVSKNGVTLFFDNGTSDVFPQTEWRTAQLLEAVLIPLAMKNGQGGVEIDLDQFSIAKQIEKLTGGAAKASQTGINQIVVEVNSDLPSAPTVIDAKPLERHVIKASEDPRYQSALAAFMADVKRIKHKHSAEELIKFMEKGDLPIADDGSILVYKWLNPHRTKKNRYCDTHTGTVEQGLGSRVSMPIEQVDDDRRVLCSSGLHVCSKHYGSYGSVCFLAKVRPSDVIAVPERERGKLRVAAYHLIGLFPKGVRTDAGMSAIDDEESARIVSNAMNGEHIGITEEVVVGGSVVENHDTKITHTKTAKPKKSKTAKKGRGPRRNLQLDVPPVATKKIDPAAIKKQIKAAQSGDLGAALTAAAKSDKKTKQPAPVDTGHSPEYLAKVEQAKTLLTKGTSLRAVGKQLGICRDKLSRFLKEQGFAW